MKYTFEVKGAPATKKNSPRMFKNKRTGQSFPMPSEASVNWTESAVIQLMTQRRAGGPPGMHRPGAGSIFPLTMGVNVCALIYRARAVGDLDNYLHAVGDALQKSGVLANDKQIEGWDRSRKLIDRGCPRVEIEITPCLSG